MYSAKVVIPAVLASLVVCVVACTGAKDDENRGQTAARAVGNGPPGNNGTVKIQEADATDEIPDNDPHVGCSLKIEFRGYDQGDLDATWELTAQAPSGKGETLQRGSVFIGEDAAGGAPDLDAVELVTITAENLAGLVKKEQGYHLKLTVNAEGSQGADKKHKVFWVDGCGGTSSSSGGSSGGSSSGGSSSGGSSGGSSSGGSSSGGSSSGQTW